MIYGYQLEPHPPQKIEEQTEKQQEKENEEEMKDEQQKTEKPSCYNIQVVHAKKGNGSYQDLISFPFIMTFFGDLTGKQIYDRVLAFVSQRYCKPESSFDPLPFSIHLIDQARDDMKQSNIGDNSDSLVDFSKKKTLGKIKLFYFLFYFLFIIIYYIFIIYFLYFYIFIFLYFYNFIFL